MPHSSTTANSISRRYLLAASGALALTAACGSNTGRAGRAGDRPALDQWYHQYGEAGTEQAVKRYAAAYRKCLFAKPRCVFSQLRIRTAQFPGGR